MGGKPYLNEADKKARRSAVSLKYYHKTKNNPGVKEKNREIHRKASLTYYHRNKETCVERVLKWRLENPLAYKRIQQKAYYKKKYNRTIIFIKKELVEKPQPILAVIE